MVEIRVARVEIYPPEEPTGWAIGFTVTCRNRRSFYIDTIVNYNEATSDEDAVNIAIEKLRDKINEKVEECKKNWQIIGNVINI